MKNNLDNENNNKLDSTMKLRLTLYSTILTASTIIGVALYKNANDLNKSAVDALENKSIEQTIDSSLDNAKSNSDNTETAFAPMGWEMIPGTNFCQRKTNDDSNEVEEEITKSNENSDLHAPLGWEMIPGTNFCQRKTNDDSNKIEEGITKSNENSDLHAPFGWELIPGTNFCQRKVPISETNNKEYGRSRTIKTIYSTLFLIK